ncbi:MAG: hypothetical protein V4592_09595 [Bacteroidota bacterium]
MKTLRFNFCHPIKGFANLIQLKSAKSTEYRVSFDSKDSNLVEIPIGDCLIGQWKVVLNWEYDDELFVHQKEFEVK